MSEIRLSFDIKHNDFDRAGAASSNLKNSLKQLGYPPEDIRRVAIASYEAEMNVVVHASDGKMEAIITPEMVDIWVIDKGPGIENIELAMQEGYSTAPDKIRELGFGAGMGLPNIKKNSDFFEIESKVPDGTKVHFIIRRKTGK